MTNPTPGPWVVSQFDTTVVLAKKDYADGRTIRVICRPGNIPDTCEREANARLIVAAEELLDVLRLILPLAKGYAPTGQTDEARKTCQKWVDAAEAVIAGITLEQDK